MTCFLCDGVVKWQPKSLTCMEKRCMNWRCQSRSLIYFCVPKKKLSLIGLDIEQLVLFRIFGMNLIHLTGYKSRKLLLCALLFCDFSLIFCSYMCTFCIFALLSGSTFVNISCLFIWVQGYTTSLALYFSRNTIKTRIWLVKGRSLLSARTLIGCVFCHSCAPRGFIFRPQWGATAAEWTSEEFHGGFTLNSFLASPIHGAGSKRLEHRDSLCVGWLWIVLRGVTGLIRRACWNISVW